MSAADYKPQLGSPASGVVITGGASGIGLASAQALAAVGRPVALWDINVEGAKAAAAEIAARYGVRTVGLDVDLRKPQAIVPAGLCRGMDPTTSERDAPARNAQTPPARPRRSHGT